MILLRTLVAAAFLAVLFFLVKGWMGSTAKEGPSDPTALQISLEVRPAEQKDAAPGHEPIIVRFQNVSTQPIRILKPLVGSDKGWNLPFYILSVTSPLGREVPMGAGGIPPAPSAEPKWPDDYLVEIQPGKSYEANIGFNRDLPMAGRYKLRFTYLYDPANPGVMGNANSMVYPKGLWIGTATSEALPVDLSAWFAAQPNNFK